MASGDEVILEDEIVVGDTILIVAIVRKVVQLRASIFS